MLAQTRAKVERGPFLTSLYVSYAGLNALDVWTTKRFLDRGHEEGNDHLRGCVRSMGCMVAVKASVTVGVILLVDKVILPTSKPMAISQMLILNTIVGGFVIHNWGVAFSVQW